MGTSRLTAWPALGLLLLAGCATAPAAVPAGVVSSPPPTTLAEVGEFRPGSGIAKGFLAVSALPDSEALLPPPPVPPDAGAGAVPGRLLPAVPQDLARPG